MIECPILNIANPKKQNQNRYIGIINVFNTLNINLPLDYKSIRNTVLRFNRSTACLNNRYIIPGKIIKGHSNMKINIILIINDY